MLNENLTHTFKYTFHTYMQIIKMCSCIQDKDNTYTPMYISIHEYFINVSTLRYVIDFIGHVNFD